MYPHQRYDGSDRERPWTAVLSSDTSMIASTHRQPFLQRGGFLPDSSSIPMTPHQPSLPPFYQHPGPTIHDSWIGTPRRVHHYWHRQPEQVWRSPHETAWQRPPSRKETLSIGPWHSACEQRVETIAHHEPSSHASCRPLSRSFVDPSPSLAPVKRPAEVLTSNECLDAYRWKKPTLASTTSAIPSVPLSAPMTTALGSRTLTAAKNSFTTTRQAVNASEHRSAQLPVGVKLVHVSRLPDRYRAAFPYPVFNAVQSTCFESIAESDANVVVSAPTGSGKTVLFELAVIRLLRTTSKGTAVYIAPTKALCSERMQDWTKRLQPLNCPIAELTGDTGYFDSVIAQKARLLITTPEKWDSLTRSWLAHRRLLDSLRLCLIDEVHSLHERSRGARLEVVVSRLQTFGTGIRFIAVSATIPNIDDFAQWIGHGPVDDLSKQSSPRKPPARAFIFGEEYRPCALEKFVYGYSHRGDDWSFQSLLDSKLAEIIQMHSDGQPVLVFVPTRKAAQHAAQTLKDQFDEMQVDSRYESTRSQGSPSAYTDRSLQQCSLAGVLFHHAGLPLDDRRKVEEDFLNGRARILCCTTTLAVGVNLPAYCIIVRGTKRFENGTWKELSDLDIVQMLGRAGRPQFGRKGVAIIMTHQEKREHYLKLASGRTIIESTLHHELLEHINSEVGLRSPCTVADLERWLRGTFLYVRLQENPTYYQKEGDTESSLAPQERLRQLFMEAVARLDKHSFLIKGNDGLLGSTEYGEILSKYFISFETMLSLVALDRPDIGELLQAVCCAQEFSIIRMRTGEKAAYAAIRKHPEIRFPPDRITSAADKISLIIQGSLAGLSLQHLLKNDDHAVNPLSDKIQIFRLCSRVVQASVDVALTKRDPVMVQSALELLRSFNAQAWDQSPEVLRQLDGIGARSVELLSQNGLRSYRDIAATAPSRLQVIIGRHPPFGQLLAQRAAILPQFAIFVEKVAPKVQQKVEESSIVLKIGIGLCNPSPLHTKTASKEGVNYFLNILTFTSDHETLLDMRRMPLSMLVKAHREVASATPKSFCLQCPPSVREQSIVVSASCDEVAGSETRALFSPIEGVCQPLQQPMQPKHQSLRLTRGASAELDGLEDCPDLFLNGADEDFSSYFPPANKGTICAPTTTKAKKADARQSGKQPIQNVKKKVCKAKSKGHVAREGDEVLQNLNSLLAKTKTSTLGLFRKTKAATVVAKSGSSSDPDSIFSSDSLPEKNEYAAPCPRVSNERPPVQAGWKGNQRSSRSSSGELGIRRKGQGESPWSRRRKTVVRSGSSSGSSSPPILCINERQEKSVRPLSDQDEALSEIIELRNREWRRSRSSRCKMLKKTMALLRCTEETQSGSDDATRGQQFKYEVEAAAPVNVAERDDNGGSIHSEPSSDAVDELLHVEFPIEIFDDEGKDEVSQARGISHLDDIARMGDDEHSQTSGLLRNGMESYVDDWRSYPSSPWSTAHQAKFYSEGSGSDPFPSSLIIEDEHVGMAGASTETHSAKAGTEIPWDMGQEFVCDNVDRLLNDETELDAWLQQHTIAE